MDRIVDVAYDVQITLSHTHTKPNEQILNVTSVITEVIHTKQIVP